VERFRLNSHLVPSLVLPIEYGWTGRTGWIGWKEKPSTVLPLPPILPLPPFARVQIVRRS